MTSARAKFRELTRVFDPIYRPYHDAGDGPGSSYVPETHEDSDVGTWSSRFMMPAPSRRS